MKWFSPQGASRLLVRHVLLFALPALLIGGAIGALGAWLTIQAMNDSGESQQLRLVRGPDAFDTGFLQAMQKHHSQAIQMAMLMRRDQVDPEIRSLAEAIVITQTHEMGLITGWLAAWSLSPVSIGPAMAWVDQAKGSLSAEDALFVSRCRSNNGSMDGMASSQDIAQLSTLQGPALEDQFLRLMLAHHRAAVDMASFAQRHTQSSFINSLALAVQKDQKNEMGWIQSRLGTKATKTSQTPP